MGFRVYASSHGTIQRRKGLGFRVKFRGSTQRPGPLTAAILHPLNPEQHTLTREKVHIHDS